jgi:uncharacterized membrane protein
VGGGLEAGGGLAANDGLRQAAACVVRRPGGVVLAMRGGGLCRAVMAESSCGVIWGKLIGCFFPEPVCSMVVRSGCFSANDGRNLGR